MSQLVPSNSLTGDCGAKQPPYRSMYLLAHEATQVGDGMAVGVHGHVDGCIMRCRCSSSSSSGLACSRVCGDVIRAGGRKSAECCVGGVGDGLGGVSVAPTKTNAA